MICIYKVSLCQNIFIMYNLCRNFTPTKRKLCYFMPLYWFLSRVLQIRVYVVNLFFYVSCSVYTYNNSDICFHTNMPFSQFAGLIWLIYLIWLIEDVKVKVWNSVKNLRGPSHWIFNEYLKNYLKFWKNSPVIS